MDAPHLGSLAACDAADTLGNHSEAGDIQSPAACERGAERAIGSDAVANRPPSAPGRANAPTDRLDATTDRTLAVRAPIPATNNQLPAGDDRSLTAYDASSRVHVVTAAVLELTERVDEVRGRA
jgi:hypothetical protein